MIRVWPGLLGLARIVQPDTIMRWHRAGFRAYWRWKSQGRAGRPRIERELRDLIRRMCKENPLWGAPRKAMACGTPVIAFNGGAVPEIVEDGVTGFVVEDEREAVAAAHRLPRLSRGAIRRRFEERFTAKRIAREYLVVYRSLIEFEALRSRGAVVISPTSRLAKRRGSNKVQPNRDQEDRAKSQAHR